MDTTPRPHPADMTWPEFRQHYEGSDRTSRGRWLSAAKAFERICHPEKLTDVTDAMLSQFVDGLRDENFPIESIRGRLTDIRLALKYGFDAGLIDSARFDVEYVRNTSPRDNAPPFHWQWRKARKWFATEKPGTIVKGSAA